MHPVASVLRSSAFMLDNYLGVLCVMLYGFVFACLLFY